MRRVAPVEAYPLGSVVLSGEIMVRFLQGGVFALFLVLSRFFRVKVGHFAGGILDGFGIASVGILVASFFRSEAGTKMNNFFRYSPSVSYIIAVLVWLVSFRGGEDDDGTPSIPKTQLQQMRDEIHSRFQLAKRLMKQ